MDVNVGRGRWGAWAPKEPIIEREPTREEILAYTVDKATARKRMVTLISGLCIMLCSGILYLWSVFQPFVVSEMGWQPSQVAMTSGLMITFFVGGNLIGGQLMSRLSARQICLSGSVLFSLGLTLTSMLKGGQPGAIYITYSLVSGVGCGLVYCTVLNVLQQWYPGKTGFISGLTVGFFGLSTVALSPAAEALLRNFGVSATFRVFAGVFFAVLMLASAFMTRPSKLFCAAKAAAQRQASAAKQFTPMEVIKEPGYYCIAFCIFAACAAYMLIVPFIKTIALDRGISNNIAVIAVMVTGIGNAAGRVIFPALSDKFGRAVPIMLSAIVSCLACVLMVFANTGILYVSAVFLIAVGYGGGSGCFPVLTRTIFGAKHSGTNYGLVLVFLAVSSVTFSGIASAMSSGGANLNPAFIICAIVSLTIIPTTMLLKRRCKKIDVNL